MPTISAHVPEDWELAPLFEQRITNYYRGRPGSYIRDVVEKDLRAFEREELTRHGAISTQADAADAMSDTVLVELTRRLLGELDAEEMARRLEGRDQRRQLRDLLRDFLDDGGLHANVTRVPQDPTIVGGKVRPEHRGPVGGKHRKISEEKAS